jgi:hypothetical protein
LVNIVDRVIPFDIVHVTNYDALDEGEGAIEGNLAHVSAVALTEDGGVLIAASLDDLVGEAVDDALHEMDVNEAIADSNANRLMVEITGGEHLADLGLLASLRARVNYGPDGPSDREIDMLEDLSRRVAPVAERLLSRYIAARVLAVTDEDDSQTLRPIYGLRGYDGTHVILQAMHASRTQRTPRKKSSRKKTGQRKVHR